MFELAGLSTFLDIFQKAFGLIEKRRDQKRRLLDEIVEPIYTQLSPVVGEYYEFFRGCRDGFSQTHFENWPAVLSERRKKREEMVLARNTVLGMISPFLAEERKRGVEDNKLLYRFAEGIEQFFYASDDLPGRTRATSLFEHIERTISRGNESYKWLVIRQIEDVLQTLEWKWRVISIAYGDLRVYCLS